MSVIRKHIRNLEDETPLGQRLCDLLVDTETGESVLEFKTGKHGTNRISLKTFLSQVDAALGVNQ